MSANPPETEERWRPIAAVGELLEERIPERWKSRLGLVRSLFVKDPVEQLRRLALLIRHFEEYRQIDRALFYHRYASTLLMAHELGIFQALEDGEPEGATPDEVASGCDMDAAAAHKLLRLLESQRFVDNRDGRYRAREAARQLLGDDSPVSLKPMLDIGVCYASAFPAMVDGARSGQTAPMLDVFDDDGRVDALLDGVNAYLDQAGRELVARVDWPPIDNMIVGSMGVSFSSLLLSQFPGAQVTYGCLAHLTERIPRLRREYDVAPRRVVETHDHGGDPSEDQWGREAFDLVFLTKKMILAPEDELGEQFAKKAFDVLNPGGVTVFWEAIFDDGQPTPIQRAMEGFLDLGVSPTGPLLTHRKFRNSLRQIGYRDIEYYDCLEGATTFAVARKPG